MNILEGLTCHIAKEFIDQGEFTHYTKQKSFHSKKTEALLLKMEPCENCGKLSSGGNSMVFAQPNPLIWTTVKDHLLFVEQDNPCGISDDGFEYCESCEGE